MAQHSAGKFMPSTFSFLLHTWVPQHRYHRGKMRYELNLDVNDWFCVV